MKVINVRFELRSRGMSPPSVSVVVHPGSGRERRCSADGSRSGRNLAERSHGPLDPIGRREVEQLPFALRGDCPHARGETRRGEQLEVDEPRVGDREEQPTQTAGLHHFHIDAIWQDRDVAAANELRVLCLRHHRRADGEEHDHDGHTEAKADEEQAARHGL